MAFSRIDFDLPVEMFHALTFEGAANQMWVPRLDADPTLVLGSTQPTEIVDAAQAEDRGVTIARRRSGGGMVMVSDADVIWVDVIIDDTSPHWTPDVVRAFEWVGAACRRALDDLGHPTEMHTGPPLPSTRPEICFAGIGPGELIAGTRKVVGISQRRTRTAARFQIAVLRRWRPADYTDLLALDETARGVASAQLAEVATGIDSAPESVVSALLSAFDDA